MVIFGNFIPALFSWTMRVGGITIFPFIFLRTSYIESEERERIINHEKIHLRQQLEMLIIFFYLWYLIEYIIEVIKYGKKAYRLSSFEMESYDNDDNLQYLKTRKLYSWIKYL